MKKIVLTCVTLILALTAMAIQPSGNIQNGPSARSKENEANLFVTFSTAFQDFMQPANRIASYPLNKNCGWLPCRVDDTFYKYDASGNMLEESYGDRSNIEYEYRYDEVGHLISARHYSEDGNLTSTREYKYNQDGYVCNEVYYNGIWDTRSYTDYTYDDILKNFLIKEESFEEGPNGNPTPKTTERRKILRNNIGNIIKIYWYANDEDENSVEYGPCRVIEYDEDNIARNIKEVYIYPDSKDYKVYVEYSDIEWYCTDGQLVFELIHPYIYDGLLEGPSLTRCYLPHIYWSKLDFNNLIKSVTITDYENYENTPNKYLYEFTYPDYLGSYTCNISYNDQLITSETFGILDSFGSEVTDKHYYMRYDRNVEKFVPYEYIEYDEYLLDRFGFGLLISKEGTPENLMETYDKDEITYYEANQPPYYYPIELPHEYIDRGYKYIYSDYVETVSSTKTIVDTENTIRYYTIEGKLVNGDFLAPGIYIKVTGNKSEKIIIR